MSVTAEERVAPASHIVGLFGDERGFTQSVADFLAVAARQGDTAIAIVTGAHRRALTDELCGRGVDVANTVIMLDASATLASFMSDGRLNRDAFHARMGDLLRPLCGSGRAARVFGEMVAVLWEAGEVNQAIELESRWNELGGILPFSLYCGYPRTSVCGSEHAESFRRMRQLHDHTFDVPSSADSEGPRANDHRARFDADHTAPHAVRRFVAGALGYYGVADVLINNAVLVSSELAANAVIHTGAPFWVTLSSSGPVIRLEIRDAGSPVTSRGESVLVVRRERGLGIVSSFASRWGTYGEGYGKVVWAEFDGEELP